MAFYKSMTKLEAMTVYLPTELVIKTDQYNRLIRKSELEITDFIGRYKIELVLKDCAHLC